MSFIDRIFDNIYLYGFANLSVLAVTTFIGLPLLGILALLLGYTYILKNKLPYYDRLFRAGDNTRLGHSAQKITYIVYTYFWALIIPAFFFLGVGFYLLKVNTELINYIYMLNGWYFSFLSEIFPSIEGHSELAASRGDALSKLYEVILGLQISFMLLSITPIVLGLKEIRSALSNLLIFEGEKRRGNLSWVAIGLLSIISTIVFIYWVAFFDSGVNHTANPWRGWDSLANDLYIYRFVIFSWIPVYLIVFLINTSIFQHSKKS